MNTYKANIELQRKVKKRKCKVHVAFHDDLDKRLDAVASSVSFQDCEDENGASSSRIINNQKKVSILVILLTCLFEITLFFAGTG